MIANIASIISYSAISNSDIVGLNIFGKRLHDTILPSKKLYTTENIVNHILEFDNSNISPDYAIITKEISKLKIKSLIFIIGDFLIKDLKLDIHKLGFKHDIVAIIIRDTKEENPLELTSSQKSEYIDIESKVSKQFVMSSSLIENYRHNIKNHDDGLKKYFDIHNIRFSKIYSDEDPFLKLAKVFR